MLGSRERLEAWRGKIRCPGRISLEKLKGDNKGLQEPEQQVEEELASNWEQ